MEETDVTYLNIRGPLGKWALTQLLKKTLKKKLGESCEVDFGDVALRVDQEHVRLVVEKIDISLSADDFKELLKG